MAGTEDAAWRAPVGIPLVLGDVELQEGEK